MKRLLCLTAALILCLFTAACTDTGIVHCDRCGTEIRIPAGSNMKEDWIVYCSDCESELGLDTLVQEITIIP